MKQTFFCYKMLVMIYLLVLSFAFSNVLYSSGGSLSDFPDEQVFQSPEITWQPHLDNGNVKALFYNTLDYMGKPTRAFAYFSIPESNKPVPAMVLVHGGGGTAFHQWVKIWNDRGYAAISMSLEGHMPDSTGTGKFRHDFSGPDRKGIFDDIDLPIEQQWMYHAISDIILAHSLLTSFPEIDADRIGITGISWGGILSSLVSGIDSRLKCAIPVYGCGYLSESKGHFNNFRESNPLVIEKKKFWDPSNYFVNGKVPTLWINGDSDAHFSLNSTSMSFLSTIDHALISIHPSMKHGHQPGWDPVKVPEIYTFADYFLKDNMPEPGRIRIQPTGRNCSVSYESSIRVKKADVYCLNERLTYYKSDEELHPYPADWMVIPAEINSEEKTVKVQLPLECMTYYVNLIDEKGHIISSSLVELEEEPLQGRNTPDSSKQSIIRCSSVPGSSNLIVESVKKMDEICIYKTGGKLIYNKNLQGQYHWVSIPGYKDSIVILRIKLVNGEVITRKVYMS